MNRQRTSQSLDQDLCFCLSLSFMNELHLVEITKNGISSLFYAVEWMNLTQFYVNL